MTPPPSTRRRSSRRRKRSRSRYALARIGRIWQAWRFELLAAALALLAVLLLVEDLDILETLSSWLGQALAGLVTLIAGIGQSLVRLVDETSFSDLIAYLLLVAVVVLIGWRTRYRLRASPRLSENRCPRCGSTLHRIHRRWHHRVLSLFISVRRYSCDDQACGWRGLRIKNTGRG